MLRRHCAQASGLVKLSPRARLRFAATAAAVSLFSLTGNTRAANEFFDLNGATAGFGTFTDGATYDWDATGAASPAGPYWSTATAGNVATIAWPQGNFPRFNPQNVVSYTVTMSNAEHNVGMFFGSGTTATNIAQTVTLVATGAGSLMIDGGVQQGFFAGPNTTININAPITENVAGGGPSFSRALTGNTPTFVLSSTANSFTGGLTVNTGVTLKLGAAGVIPDANPLTVSGGTVSLNGFDETVAGLASGFTASTVNLGGNTLTLNVPSAASRSWFGNDITGAGKIVKTGPGTQIFSTNYGWTGGLQILGGVVKVDRLNASGTSSSIGAASSAASNLVIDGGTLNWVGSSVAGSTDRGYTIGSNGGTFDSSGSTFAATFSGNMVASATSGTTLFTLTGTSSPTHVISGTINDGAGSTTSVLKTGVGTWQLSGANAYSGTTTVSNGTLVAGATNTLPAASTLVVNGGTLNMTGFDQTVSSVSLQSGAISGVGATLTSPNNFDVRSGTITAKLAGAGGLNKTTSGNVTISGANTYAGNTTISLGTLYVNNTSGSGTSSGTVTVNATDSSNFGTLAGTGTINGAVTVNANAHISPGINGGNAVLSLHTASIKADSNLDFALGAAGVNPGDFGVNDLLAVLDPSGLSLDTTGSGIATIHLAGGGAGKYHLIQYDTALGTGGLANLNVATGVGTGIDAATLSLSNGVGNIKYIDVLVTPTSRSWIAAGGGNWSDGTKWGATNAQPTGAGAVATFANSITADSTVTIDDASKTVGSLTLNNSAFKYNIAAASTNKLILDGVGTLPLTVLNGNHTISAPLQLNKNVNVTVTNAADSLTISGAVSGTNTAFTASGAGTLLVSGAMTNGGAFTNNNTGTVSIGSIVNNAGITNNGNNLTIAGVISGTAAPVAITNNSGTLAITGTANTFSSNTGKIVINGGTLAVAADGSLGVATGSIIDEITMANGSTLRLLNGAALSASRGITFASDTGITLDVPSGTASWAAYYTISGAAGTTTTVTKTGAGQLNLSSAVVPAPVNYNRLVIAGGVFQVNNSSPLPTDNITLKNGGTLQFSAAAVATTTSRTLTVDAGGGSFLQTTGASTWAGQIVDGAATGTLTMPGAGNLVLSNFNTYSGGTILNGAGTTTIGSDGALGTGPVTWSAGAINANGAHSVGNPFTLAGNVTVSGTNDLTFQTGAWTLTGDRTLTDSNSGFTIISSVIGEDAPGRSFTKAGTGTMLLVSANTYSGSTTISGGVLQISDSSNLGSATNTLVFNGGKLVATGAINGGGHNVIVNAGGGTLDDSNNAVTLGNVDGTGPFTKTTGTGTLTVNRLRAGAVAIHAGMVAVTPSGGAAGTSHVGTLTIDGGSKIDISNNKLITSSPVGTWTGSAYTDVTGQVVTGRNGGSWTGLGIVTSQTQAAAGNFTTLGVATASQAKGIAATATAVWAGQTVTGSESLVMYTYGGDANLDGKINVDDYTRIDFNVPLGTNGWYNGDFNYDGKINVDDYTIIDFNVGIQGAPFFAAGVAESGGLSGVSAVPEPASLSLIGLGAASLLGRRRRRN